MIAQHAGVAELADAYGSGPYEGSLMKVQVLSPAPDFSAPSGAFFLAQILMVTRNALCRGGSVTAEESCTKAT